VGGCASHPAHRRPGASRADHRPGRQRPYARHGLGDVAARAAARYHGGGSTAHGMTRCTRLREQLSSKIATARFCVILLYGR
jgi:hypothetical protein